MGLLDPNWNNWASPAPTGLKGLLAQQFDPKEMRYQAGSNALTQLGIGLLNPDPKSGNPWLSGLSRGFAGAAQGVQDAQDQFYKRGFDNVKLMGLQREQDQYDKQQAAFAAFRKSPDFAKLTPAMQTYFDAYPEQAFEAWMKAQYPGTNEFGLNPIVTYDESTKKYHLYQPDKRGGPPREMLLPYDYQPQTTQVDTGTGTRLVSTKGGNTVGDIPKDLSGAAEQTAVGKNVADLRNSLPKVRANMKLLDGQWDMVHQTIAEASQMIDSGWLPNTGTIGSLASAVPGTPQYDLAQKLSTIKANIGFDKLAAMRDASPTGGALGNVSDFENQLLQAVNGSLQQGQTAQQLKGNLAKVDQLLSLLSQEKHQAFDETYSGLTPTVGGPAQPVAGSSGPSSGNVIKYDAQGNRVP